MGLIGIGKKARKLGRTIKRALRQFDRDYDPLASLGVSRSAVPEAAATQIDAQMRTKRKAKRKAKFKGIVR